MLKISSPFLRTIFKLPATARELTKAFDVKFVKNSNTVESLTIKPGASETFTRVYRGIDAKGTSTNARKQAFLDAIQNYRNTPTARSPSANTLASYRASSPMRFTVNKVASPESSAPTGPSSTPTSSNPAPTGPSSAQTDSSSAPAGPTAGFQLAMESRRAHQASQTALLSPHSGATRSTDLDLPAEKRLDNTAAESKIAAHSNRPVSPSSKAGRQQQLDAKSDTMRDTTETKKPE